MEKTYERLGQPGIFRNDRFWLAGDHVVDPRITKMPQVKALIDASERAKRIFKMTDYQGMNVRLPYSSTLEIKANQQIVYYSSYRVLSRASSAGHANHRLRFAHLLFRCRRVSIHWPWCSRCDYASGYWRDMVQSARVCQRSTGWPAQTRDWRQGCYLVYPSAVKTKHGRIRKNRRVYWPRAQISYFGWPFCNCKYDHGKFFN